MALTPRFNIIPHGIIKSEKKNPGSTNSIKYEAMFKVSVSIREFEKTEITDDPTKIPPVTTDEFIKFIKDINEYKYLLGYENGKVKLIVDTSNPATRTTINSSMSYISDQSKESFNFAKATTQLSEGENNSNKYKSISTEEQLGTLKALAREKFNLATVTPPRQLMQLDIFASSEENSNHYHDVLTSINNYAKKSPLKKSSKQPLDFRVIYANIMNEPILAEEHFGIIKSYTLDADALLDKKSTLKYQVELTEISEAGTVVTNSDTHPELNISYLLTRINGKYYNGLEKIFFKSDEFELVNYQYYDLYKSYLEKRQLHPDGIYINVKYHEEVGELQDPFDKPGLKGYNCIIHSGSFQSLSFHEIEYKFENNTKNLKNRTSGTLTARSEIINGENAYRNNVLLAWRGDNLLVNRKANKELIDQETNIDTKHSAYNECEDVFINEHFFSMTERLVEGTQLQLTSGHDYRFLFRTVSYLEHYMPIASEIKGTPEAEFTMTVEDFINSTTILEEYTITPGPITPNFLSVANLPIKSVDIIGKKKFGDKNTGFVDNGNHIVLNRISKEKKEKRFIYPPSIKLEDIRMLGYQSPELIKMDGEAQLTRDEFVYRCIRMEKRNENNLPERACKRTTVDYLADPRGKKLLFVPNDLYTLLQLPKTQFKEVYEYMKQYPFYDDTESSKLELRFNKGTNSSQLLLNDEILYSRIPQGIYNFNIYVADKAFGIDEIKQYNSTSLKISCVDKPKVPKISTVPNFAFDASRNPSSDPAKNYWFLPIEMDESNTWKSLKYTEETTVLNLNQSDYSKLLKRKLRKGMSSYDLMFDEYPYETFLTTEGDVDYKGELRTSIFPEKIKITLVASQSLKLANDSIFMSLMLNDKEKLIVRSVGSKLGLYMNDVFLLEQAEQFELQIVFNIDKNCFDIMKGEKSIRSLINYINPDISVKDIEISKEILHLIYQQGSNCKINLERAGSYIFLTDNRHPYSVRKRVKLFASSPYQAYFPKVESEFSLGTTGSVFDIMIPNNTLPLKPVIDAEVLLMYTKDQSWHDREIKKFKKTKTQSLIRITMGADYMMEGHNKLGIIIRNIVGDPTFGKVSLIGDDITKLSKSNFTNQTLKNMLDNEDLDKPLFKKYLAPDAIQNYLIEGQNYEVLLCTPFYNSVIRKWQVILPLGNFSEAESMFVKLSCVKISEGHGFDIVQGQNVTVLRDLTGTNLSPITDPIIFPIYSPREISINCQKDTYRIQYNGSVSNKLFFVIYINDDDGVSTIMDKNGTKNFVSFSCPAANDPQENGRILLFSQTDIIISKKNASKLLVLEFETHDNFKIQDFNALQNFKGKISDAPVFVTENPMFEIDGIRLINAAEFKL